MIESYLKRKATRVGVEPTTFRLTAECSNQLSYQVEELAGLALRPDIILAAVRPQVSYQVHLPLRVADGLAKRLAKAKVSSESESNQ